MVFIFTTLSFLYPIFDEYHDGNTSYVILCESSIYLDSKEKYLNFFVNLAISYILIQLLMSTRVRNPEVYVKGYGKNTTKDDLK